MPGTRQLRGATAIKAPQQNTSSSNISSFGRVSKTVSAPNVKKEPVPSTPKKERTFEIPLPSSRKRKAFIAVDDSEEESKPKKLATAAKSTPKKAVASSDTAIFVKPASKKLAASTSTTTTTTKSTSSSTKSELVLRGRERSKRQQATPSKKRYRSPSVSDSDVSTVVSKALFKKLRLEDSSPSRAPSPLTADTSIAGSDIEADTTARKAGKLPQEVLDLISLHSAFLRALTLHYAHNGSVVPVDLRTLCAEVTRAWGKKSVTVLNIRTCLGILSRTSKSSSPSENPLILTNYGRSKICVEMEQSSSGGLLNENKLNELFRANINALWTEFLNGGKTDAKTFVVLLPKADVTVCDSVVKAAPLLSNGQKRLEDLKQGIALKKQEKAAPSKPATSTDTPMLNADGTKMSLLDRIRLKSLQKTATPTGLSPAQLERRGALHRVEEVSSLIGMLSRASNDMGTMGRISFTMPALLEKLKDSFRMGISKPEGAACVRLLANEVAPEWVRVVTLAGRENVVVEVACQLGKPEIARRVQNILAKE